MCKVETTSTQILKLYIFDWTDHQLRVQFLVKFIGEIEMKKYQTTNIDNYSKAVHYL